MSISGNGGSRYSDPNGYDEPPPDQAGANHMNSDYANQPSIKQNRGQAFKEGHGR